MNDAVMPQRDEVASLPAEHGAPTRYDAFISFASADRKIAQRIQRFLESWTDPRTKRRLRVFLDNTDLRGGRLDAELRAAAHGARTLIVCYSAAAAESRWVQSEIRLFVEKSEPNRIAVAIVGGHRDAAEVGALVLPGIELRVHELRSMFGTAMCGNRARVELLRLLAFVADVDLRTLRNWYLRRSLRNIALFIALAFVPIQLLLNMQIPDWELLTLRNTRGPVYPVAAELVGNDLLLASRFRGAGPQGFRDYISFDRYVGGTGVPEESFDNVALTRRLLPNSRLPLDARGPIPRINIAAITTRLPKGPPWTCQLSAERAIHVIPLAPTQDEIDDASDRAADFQTPIPEVAGSIVVTVENGVASAAVVDDLSPIWQEMDGSLGRASPARGLAVAWSPQGDVWLGMQGRDGLEDGGLWRRLPGQQNWARMPGFTSVQSVDVEVTKGRTRRVWVAERHAERWRGLLLEPKDTRLVRLDSGDQVWRTAPGPPYGTRSEVEIAGRLNGALIVRVDDRIYREGSVSLWQFLTRANR